MEDEHAAEIMLQSIHCHIWQNVFNSYGTATAIIMNDLINLTCIDGLHSASQYDIAGTFEYVWKIRSL